MTKFVESVETKDALGFKEHYQERIADKVVTALEACKVEVAKQFFAGVGKVENSTKAE